MTRGNQRELARQKNMKKQSDSVKGKRRDDGLSAAARKQSVLSSSWSFF
uniref:Small EDRK-rich factor 2 n=1 Tax=Mus musculus TaxID=10090 RepID=D6RCY2_MOUSE